MSDAALPGWYHAEGDPPGTERFWDGSAWTEGPRPVGGVPDMAAPDMAAPDMAVPETPSPQTPGVPQDGFGAPAAGMPPGAMPPGSVPPAGLPQGGFPGAPGGMPGAAAGFYPEESKATTALVVAIVGALLCGPVSIVGAVMGNKERKAIAEGRRDPAGQGKATAALVIGAIVGVLTILFILLIVVIVIFGASS